MFPWSKKEQPKEEEKKDIGQAITDWVKQFLPYQEEIEDEEESSRQEPKKQKRTEKQKPRADRSSDEEKADFGDEEDGPQDQEDSLGGVTRALLMVAGLPGKVVTGKKYSFSDIAWWFFSLALYLFSPYIVFAYLETEVNKALMSDAHQVVASAAGIFAVSIALALLVGLLFSVITRFLVERALPKVSESLAFVVVTGMMWLPLIVYLLVAPAAYTAFGGHWTTFLLALICILLVALLSSLVTINLETSNLSQPFLGMAWNFFIGKVFSVLAGIIYYVWVKKMIIDTTGTLAMACILSSLCGALILVPLYPDALPSVFQDGLA